MKNHDLAVQLFSRTVLALFMLHALCDQEFIYERNRHGTTTIRSPAYFCTLFISTISYARPLYNIYSTICHSSYNVAPSFYSPFSNDITSIPLTPRTLFTLSLTQLHFCLRCPIRLSASLFSQLSVHVRGQPAFWIVRFADRIYDEAARPFRIDTATGAQVLEIVLVRVDAHSSRCITMQYLPDSRQPSSFIPLQTDRCSSSTKITIRFDRPRYRVLLILNDFRGQDIVTRIFK